MQLAAFKAVCPFEIGDTVIDRDGSRVITDILAVHSIKTGTVRFMFEFDGKPGSSELEGHYLRKGCVHYRVYRE